MNAFAVLVMPGLIGHPVSLGFRLVVKTRDDTQVVPYRNDKENPRPWWERETKKKADSFLRQAQDRRFAQNDNKGKSGNDRRREEGKKRQG